MRNEELYEINKKEYIKIMNCKNNGNPIPMGKLKEYNLKDYRWYINKCNNKNVKTYNDWIRYELKLIPNNALTKQECITIIKRMSDKLGRPLKYDDFRCKNSQETLNIGALNKYWNGINEMKKELNLPIIQENMCVKHISNFNDVICEIHRICDLINENENRKVITYKDIVNNNNFGLISRGIFESYAKNNNTTIRKIIEEYGYKLQKKGTGLNYTFDDGEKVVSQLEFNFSKKLKLFGYVFNEAYFRNVKYKFIDYKYNGNMDCDYVIHINKRIIYIEIAGVLDRESYKYSYKNPITIKSKVKKKYAEKLNLKENMLKQNNKEYYILFPSDLNNLDYLFKEILHIHRKELINNG